MYVCMVELIKIFERISAEVDSSDDGNGNTYTVDILYIK